MYIPQRGNNELKPMMTIQQISAEQRVRVRRDDCGDPIIQGRNGHLYIDADVPMTYYGDGGRKAPLTRMKRNNAIRSVHDITALGGRRKRVLAMISMRRRIRR